MRVVLLAIFVAISTGFSAADAFSQAAKQRDNRRHMKHEERQRLREDLRDAYRNRDRRPEKQRQMSREERDKLRRDIQDANRDLRRR